jgi:hypothetical protein
MSLHYMPTQSGPWTWLRRRAPWILGTLFIICGISGVAYAFWQSTDSSNFAAASADSLPQGSTPTATATDSTTVAVSWSASITTGGRAVTGYTVARYNAATGGTKTSATGGCAGTIITGTSCTEQSLPAGTWYYTVTPTLSLWTGAESPRSAGVTIDSTPPTVTVSSISPAPNGNGYNNTGLVTVNLSATDIGGSGVASITYWVDSGTHTTVNVTTAAVSVTGDGTHTVSYLATDNAGNASTTQTQTVKIDTVAPGAPTVSVPSYVNSANVTNVPVSGTAEANATVNLTVTDAGAAHTVTQAVTANGTGAWSTSSLNLSTLNQGAIAYSATATDSADNTGPAGTAGGSKDTAAPTVTVNQAAGQADPTNALAINYTVAFDEPVTGFDATDLTRSGTSTGGTVTVTGSGTTYNIALTGTPTNGSIAFAVGAGKAIDAAGNSNTASTSTDNTVTYDTVAPAGLTITCTAGASGNPVTLTCTGAAGTASGDGASITVVITKTGQTTINATGTRTAATWTTGTGLTIPKNVNGWTATATQTDAAGNSSTATTTFNS